jgi:hypothetical protein
MIGRNHMTDLIPESPDHKEEERFPMPDLTWTTVQSEREQKLLQEIDRLNGIISSIKMQYEELMGVAMQYREEALKWYNKFLRGN